MNSIFVVVNKDDKSPKLSNLSREARKLLVYMSEGRALNAINKRFFNPQDFEVLEYVPKKGESHKSSEFISIEEAEIARLKRENDVLAETLYEVLNDDECSLSTREIVERVI